MLHKLLSQLLLHGKATVKNHCSFNLKIGKSFKSHLK